MSKESIGIFNSIIAAVSYGTNPLFSLPMFRAGMKVNSVLFYRYLFAIVIYYLWLKIKKRVVLKINAKQFIHLFILAIIFSMSSIFLFSAFLFIPSGLACTILFIYPVLVALIAFIFYQEKLTFKVISALIISFLGIMQLYNGEIKLDMKGIFLVLSSALCYSIYMVLIKHAKAIKNLKNEVVSFYIMTFGLLVYIVNSKFCTELQTFPNIMTFIFALGLAIFPTIISLETINIGIKLIGATKTAILGALEPLTALFFGVIFFHEQLTPKIIAGIVLIFIGVNLVIIKTKNYSNNSNN